jgi:hypothetical protein
MRQSTIPKKEPQRNWASFRSAALSSTCCHTEGKPSRTSKSRRTSTTSSVTR